MECVWRITAFAIASRTLMMSRCGSVTIVNFELVPGLWNYIVVIYGAISNNFFGIMKLSRGLAWTPEVNQFQGADARARPWTECSNRGICDRETGECECFPGYEGMACQRYQCARNKITGEECSGRGICTSQKEMARQNGRIYDTPWDATKIWGWVWRTLYILAIAYRTSLCYISIWVVVFAVSGTEELHANFESARPGQTLGG